MTGASFYAQFVAPGDLCFDIGANVGRKSKVFLSLGARVVAVEPQPSCHGPLREIAEGDPRLTIVPYGVGAEPGTSLLHLSAISENCTFSDAFKAQCVAEGYDGWPGTVRVEMTTLDALIARHGRPDFCKIDVETYELSVLRGLHRAIPHLEVEFTKPFIDDAVACVRLLGSRFTCSFNYFAYESGRLELDRWQDPDEFARTLLGLDILHGNMMVRVGESPQ